MSSWRRSSEEEELLLRSSSWTTTERCSCFSPPLEIISTSSTTSWLMTPSRSQSATSQMTEETRSQSTSEDKSSQKLSQSTSQDSLSLETDTSLAMRFAQASSLLLMADASTFSESIPSPGTTIGTSTTVTSLSPPSLSHPNPPRSRDRSHHSMDSETKSTLLDTSTT